MNKVLNINLGGYPFTVDENAYEHLKQYLDALRKHFKQTEGADEIVSDIEMRLAEIFQEKLEERPILTLALVNSGIDVMGTPEDFGAEAGFEGFQSSASADTEEPTNKKFSHRTGKRLFRNTDNEVISGVCSGIAAYLGIQDPVWIRLIFGLMAFGSFGFIIPLYIIMIFIVPEPKSAADRLAMKGEPINVDNIANMIQDEMVNLSEKISNMSNNGKKKVNGSSFDETKVRETVNQGMGYVGSIIKGIWYFLTNVIRPILIFIGAILILVLALVWIATIIGTIFVYPHAGYILTEPAWQAPMATASGLVLVGVPILSMVFLVTRLFFSTPINIRWSIGIWVMWFIAMSTLVYSVREVAEDFKASATITNEITLENATANQLSLKAIDGFDRNFEFGNNFITEDGLIIPNVQLEVEKSEDDQFHLIQHKIARGGTEDKARANIDDLNHKLTIDGNEITFSNIINIAKGKKWRAHKTKFTIKVPEGKTIKFAENMSNTLHGNSFQGHPWHMQGHIWTVSNGKLKCTTCKEGESHYEESSDLTLPFDAPFQTLQIEGNAKIYIKKADEHHITYSGKEYHTSKIEVNQEGEVLKITIPQEEPDAPTRIYIEMPSLVGLDLLNTDDVEVTGFDEDKITMTVDIESELRVDVQAEYLDITASDNTEIQLSGGGEFLKVNLSDDAELDADRYLVHVADIQGTIRNEAKVNVRDTLYKQMPEIGFEGQPFVIEK